MSRLTLLMMIPLFAAPALAGQTLEDAQAKRSKAFNDFYKRYKASQHTPEDAKAIGEQTVAPSSTSMSRAIAVERQSAYKQSGLKVMSQSEADAYNKHRREIAAERAAEEGGAAGGAPGEGRTADGRPAGGGGADGTGGVGPNAYPTRKPAPETVIDGKNIPKEITFEDQAEDKQ